MIQKGENLKTKLCPKCSGEMALYWREHKPSENAYAPERMHRLICMTCAYSRTERFARIDQFAWLALPNPQAPGLRFIENRTLDPLQRQIDAATIAVTE